MRITLAGPGRAGMALALAARAAGHDVVAVVARRPSAGAEAAASLGAPTAAGFGDPLPATDLLLVATSDDAIAEAAASLSQQAAQVAGAVHLSGLASVGVLAPLAEQGVPTGSFHPLQTLPTPDVGAARIRGSWIAVTTADAELAHRLAELATSMGARPFELDDATKPLYHAAASAAANFPMAALAMSSDLFDTAGVPFAAAGPLVAAAVDNAFALGPREALTGPVARGDVGTVERQLRAVASSRPDWLEPFRAFVGVLAGLAGRSDEFAALIGGPGEPS